MERCNSNSQRGDILHDNTKTENDQVGKNDVAAYKETILAFIVIQREAGKGGESDNS